VKDRPEAACYIRSGPFTVPRSGLPGDLIATVRPGRQSAAHQSARRARPDMFFTTESVEKRFLPRGPREALSWRLPDPS